VRRKVYNVSADRRGCPVAGVASGAVARSDSSRGAACSRSGARARRMWGPSWRPVHPVHL